MGPIIDRNKCFRRGYVFPIIVVALCITFCVVFGVTYSRRLCSDGAWLGWEHVNSRAYQSRSRVGHYRHAAVATDSEICSKIGSYILGKGGSAVDAGVAALICSGAVQLHNTGIGGGFFMIIYDTPKKGNGSKTLETLNAREVAPLLAHETMFKANTEESRIGGTAIAVPGEVKGYWEAHERYGRLPWQDLFQPTIDLCEQGINVTNSAAQAIQIMESNIRKDKGLSELFVKEDGSIVREGDIIINLKLAETLKKIAKDGLAFYTDSTLLRDIVDDIADKGGIITKQDLENYSVEWEPALGISLKNGGVLKEPLRLNTMGLASGGPVLALILNILDGYNLSSSSVRTMEGSILTYHRILEAFKFAYAKRSELGDSLKNEQLADAMTSDKFADFIRSQIDDRQTFSYEHYLPGSFLKPTHGTVHLSVMAPDGGAVSATGTINYLFGASARGTRTGIIFNDEMDDFSSPNVTNVYGYPPSSANYIRPGRRPLSSMCPSLVMTSNGTLKMNVGTSGGSFIITGLAMTIINNLWLGMPLGEAIDKSKFHNQLLPNVVKMDDFLTKDVIDGLKKKGHSMGYFPHFKATTQAIRVLCQGCIPGVNCPHYTCLEAGCDVSKDGIPDGF